jgi:glycosyltransferase involved in cell wall biosynthesis
MNPAIRYVPRGFRSGPEGVVGLQSANGGFLRAAVKHRTDDVMWCSTATRQAAADFGRAVRRLDPAVSPYHAPADRPDLLAGPGLLYLADPMLPEAARLRLRAGVAAYSLCGMTHAMASARTMTAVADLAAAPVMPWDALICTSAAVAGVVRAVLDQEFDYLRWRLGPDVREIRPELPVLPLGLHTEDFDHLPEERARSRQALGLAEDLVAALFVGRLSHEGKAHPVAMFSALQAVHETTGREIALIQCGWFADEAVRAAFADATGWACPDVRVITVDGRDPAAARQAWAAADLFVSLVDNYQESFGLTPLEAMAAGLPVVVSDWDGYRDTVRDNVDGFRISTRAPAAGAGEPIARAHEAGVLSAADYLGVTAQTVSLDQRQLVERLAALVTDAGLRAQMGAAGRRRARETFDWSVVFRQYQALWAELAARRRNGTDGPGLDREQAPLACPQAPDVFTTFSGFPTRQIGGETLAAGTDQGGTMVSRLARHPLFRKAAGLLPPEERVLALLEVLGGRELSLARLGSAVGLGLPETVIAAAVLAKMGVLELRDPDHNTSR